MHTATNMESKGCQHEPKGDQNTIKHQGRNEFEKGREMGGAQTQKGSANFIINQENTVRKLLTNQSRQFIQYATNIDA